jgi:hypothetical protein
VLGRPRRRARNARRAEPAPRLNSTSLIAELRVYMKAPGAVARCPKCDDVLIVIVDVRGTQRFDMSNMEMVSPA